jgi:hypothetical protein
MESLALPRLRWSFTRPMTSGKEMSRFSVAIVVQKFSVSLLSQIDSSEVDRLPIHSVERHFHALPDTEDRVILRAIDHHVRVG